MPYHFLEFEQPIAELEAKIEELRRLGVGDALDISEEIDRLERKRQDLTKSIFSSLTAWQITQLSRHPERPHTLDFIAKVFTDFDELFGCRQFSVAKSIVAGLARLDNNPVMVIGHEKGRNTLEKLGRNFGMPRPEDYRRAARLMKMAERYHIPIITLIDTPGAYPGIDAEERNQSGSIAQNLLLMSQLKTPIICLVTGEGCSGGALAIGVGDRLLMLQYSYYSVISPEGCASILWKSAENAAEAAETLGLTAKRLSELGLVDEIIEEPLGGAHRDVDEVSYRIKKSLIKHLRDLQNIPIPQLVEQRYSRLMSVGEVN